MEVYYHRDYHPSILTLLSGTSDTKKQRVTVFTLDRTVRAPFKGYVEIMEREVTINGIVKHYVRFTPDDLGDYWHFTLSPCFPVDGAITAGIIPLSGRQALTITKLSSIARIKRRNLLSRKIEVITLYNGLEIDTVDEFRGPIPATLISTEPPNLEAPPPAPSLALMEIIKVFNASTRF